MDRVNKGLGIVNKIMDMLKSVSFGSKYFEMANTFREAHLINGMLSSAEIWYGLQKNEITQLEEIDKLLLRRILEAPDSTCIESLFLELGLIPINIILMARRVNQLHYFATLDKKEMLYKFFISQWKYPVKDDWTLEVKENLKELDIDLTLEEIQKKSKNSFKRLVKTKTREYALHFLLDLKEKHTKMDNLQYTELKLQKYLKNDSIPVPEARNLYRFRTRCAKFKENMKTGYQSTPCPFCLVQPDNQIHSVQCSVVSTKVKIEGNYNDIFKENIPSNISKTLMNISKLREDVI